MRAEAAGLPRCTVMFLGMMTLSSTRGTQFSIGSGTRCRRLPVNSECSGMTDGRVYHVFAFLFVSRESSQAGPA